MCDFILFQNENESYLELEYMCNVFTFVRYISFIYLLFLTTIQTTNLRLCEFQSTYRRSVNHSSHNANFNDLGTKLFENIVGKGDNGGQQHKGLVKDKKMTLNLIFSSSAPDI